MILGIQATVDSSTTLMASTVGEAVLHGLRPATELQPGPTLGLRKAFRPKISLSPQAPSLNEAIVLCLGKEAMVIPTPMMIDYDSTTTIPSGSAVLW